MVSNVSTFLMFEGVAEEAMKFYASVFECCEIQEIQRYGPGEAGTEGLLKGGRFTLHGQRFMCFDSPVKHAFSFTPSISIFVELETERELEEAFTKLSVNGKVHMPIGRYRFSEKFAWVSDRFGVAWALNLA